MKKLMMYLGKYFCLMLGIFLFTSSVPAFGQDLAEQSVKGIDKLMNDIKGIETELSVFYTYLKNPDSFMERHIQINSKIPERIGKNVGRPIEELRSLSNEYAEIYARYDHYSKISNHIIEEGTLAELSRPYIDPAFTDIIPMRLKGQEYNVVSQMLPTKLLDQVPSSHSNPKTQYLMDYESSYSVLGMEKTDFNQAKKAIEYMQGKIKEMKEGIETINKAKAKLIRQTYTPTQIMEYAFKHMSEAERAAFGLGFTARDVAISVERQAEAIIKYVEAYGKGLTDPKYFSSVDDLIAELKALSPLERVEYTDEIAGLKSNKGAQKFVEDYKGLSTLEKRVVRKGVQRVWGLAALGAIATAAYITDVAADNHFSKNTISPRELGIIAKNIENGTATIGEKFAFFTNPYTKEYVKKDPVYTLSLVQLASDIYAADELLKEAQKTQEQKTKDNVENGVLKNLNQKMGMTDFGVGTL